MTRETVIAETPDASATSAMVAVPRLRRLALAIDSPLDARLAIRALERLQTDQPKACSTWARLLC
jgi:hypothetical protein